jgi:hypothetical protein
LHNEVTSPLAAGADIVLNQHASEEHSIAAGKSVVCSLLAVDLLAEALSGRADRLEARGIAVARVVAKAMASPPDVTVLETVESAYARAARHRRPGAGSSRHRMTNRTPVPRALAAERGRKEAAVVVPRTRATPPERKGWTPRFVLE